MVYLPTFTTKINQMLVNMSYTDPMGLTNCFSSSHGLCQVALPAESPHQGPRTKSHDHHPDFSTSPRQLVHVHLWFFTPRVDAVDFSKKKSGNITYKEITGWRPLECLEFVGDAKIDYDESTPMVESKVKRHMNNTSKDRHADWTTVIPTQYVNMGWIVGCF